MNLPPLPELPTPFGVFPRTVLPIEHGMGGNALVIEQLPVWSAEQINDLLEGYGRAVQEACARECDERAAVYDHKADKHLQDPNDRPIHDRFDGAILCKESAEICAAAIRNGVIREGEGEKTAAPSKRERWICLLCKSSRKGQHGTLDDKVTPCPNGAITRSTG